MNEKLVLMRFRQRNGKVALITRDRQFGVYADNSMAANKELHDNGYHDFIIIESNQPWPKRSNA